MWQAGLGAGDQALGTEPGVVSLCTALDSRAPRQPEGEAGPRGQRKGSQRSKAFVPHSRSPNSPSRAKQSQPHWTQREARPLDPALVSSPGDFSPTVRCPWPSRSLTWLTSCPVAIPGWFSQAQADSLPYLLTESLQGFGPALQGYCCPGHAPPGPPTFQTSAGTSSFPRLQLQPCSFLLSQHQSPALRRISSIWRGGCPVHPQWPGCS